MIHNISDVERIIYSLERINPVYRNVQVNGYINIVFFPPGRSMRKKIREVKTFAYWSVSFFIQEKFKSQINQNND